MGRIATILEAVGFAAEHLGGLSWEDHIQQVMARLGEAAEVSRVYVFENLNATDGSLLTSQQYEWVAPGIPAQINNPQLQDVKLDDGFKRWMLLMSQGETVHGLIKEFPRTECDFLAAQNIRSIVVVPIFVGNEWWGMIGFDDCWQERDWSPDEIESLRAAANIFAAAVQRKRMQYLEQRLFHLATYDDLTELLNRRALKEIMEREHALAVRTGRPYCLAILDLDRFKLINDTHGHSAGDRVLQSVADVIRASLRDRDYIGRWGGEEFVCFFPDTDTEHASLAMERLRQQIEIKSVAISTSTIDVSVSMGVAGYISSDDNLDAVLARADTAMYQAKREGRNRLIMAEHSKPNTWTLAQKVQSSLKAGRLLAAYQPIVDLTRRTTVAEETLARIIDENGETLTAGSFIDAASQLQMLHLIDYELVKNSIRRCVNRNLSGDVVYQFINVSADLLRHPELLAELLDFTKRECQRCSATQDQENPLVIEITEREFLGDIRQVRERLDPFLEFGIKLAVDDFGSGYSSYNYLANLPVAFLKIEGELVKLAKTENRARSILRSIHYTAKELDLVTIAESVEDEFTATMLREIGIDWAQGYHFGQPLLEINQWPTS